MEFQKTYNLIQQTPIIHFQHSEKGATLRATEVKPKLDRFIIEKMGGKENVPANWFIEDTKALNYKLRLEATGTQRVIELDKDNGYDIFYGNMNQSEDKKKMGIKGNVKMILVCLVPALKNFIDEIIESFFLVTNFGTMQNKGFGSYILENSDTSSTTIAKRLKEEYGAGECYYFRSSQPNRNNNECDERFRNIKTVYSVMKSGINFKGYHRSYLFEYCHEEMKIGNEKAAMKANEISPWLNGEPVKRPDNKKNFWDFGGHDYKYVRAMLGIGERIEYITGFYYDERLDRNGRPRGFKANCEKETIKIYNSDIERLASPIMFKVIGDYVYMLARKINNVIYNKKFSFTNSSGSYIELDTPENFDINAFLRWFVRKYNIESMTRDQNGRLPSYSIGKTIDVVDCGKGV